MKTKLLLSLMIFNLSAYCQYAKYENSLIKIIPYSDTVSCENFIKEKQRLDILKAKYSILAAYVIYEKECYNDSTLIKIAVMKRCKKQSSFNSNDMEVDYYTMDNPPAYKHKQPTFEGFIEWLKKH